jgi:hypothetical protein
MPAVANTAGSLYRENVPIRTRNSLTKVDSPGSDSPARPEIRNSPASSGATFCTPPKSAILLEPRRVIRNPARMNSAPVAKPWLTMYSVAPATPWLVIAKMPSAMKPKCETEV